MGFQLWIPQVLRAAGLTVAEVPGWQTRSGSEDTKAATYNPGGLICHETRGSATSSDAGEIGVLVNGRVGLSGPIAQCYLSRSGVWHVVAAGLCHHVRTGWGGPFTGWGNTRLFGVEPAHSETEDWADKPIQYRSYVRGVAAIIRFAGWPPPVGHKEHQPGDKPDPEFSMSQFRADVAAVLAGQGDIDMASGDDIITFLSRTIERGNLWPMNAKMDALLKAQGVAQADIDELQARPPGGGLTAEQEQKIDVLSQRLTEVTDKDEIKAALAEFYTQGING